MRTYNIGRRRWQNWWSCRKTTLVIFGRQYLTTSMTNKTKAVPNRMNAGLAFPGQHQQDFSLLWSRSWKYVSSHPQARSWWWLNGSRFSTSHSRLFLPLFPSFLFHFLSLSWAKWKHSGRFSTSHSHLFLSLFHFFLFLFYFLSLSHMSSIVLVFNGKCGRFFIQSNPIQVLQSTSTSESVYSVLH